MMNKKYLYLLAIPMILAIMFMPIFEQCEMIRDPHYTYDENGCATDPNAYEWNSGDQCEWPAKVKVCETRTIFDLFTVV